MSSLNKMLIAALVVQIALAAFMLTRSDSTTIQQLEAIVGEFDKDAINRIEIYKEPIGGADSDIAIELKKSGGSWVLGSHHDYPVTESNITTLLDKVLGMTSRGPVATSAARQTQLAVADKEYKRKLVLHGAGEPITLYVGNPAGTRKTAVRLAGTDGIHAITGFSLGNISTAMSGWIELEYFEVEPDDVASFTITNAQGTFTLERDGEIWNLAGAEAPDGTPAPDAGGERAEKELSQNEVDKLLQLMAEINLTEPADPARTFEKPLASFVLRMKSPALDDAGEGDAGASSAISPAAEEHRFEIGGEQDGKYHVRRIGDERAIWLFTGTFDSLVELDRDKLYKEKKDEAAEGAAPTLAPGAIPGLPGGPGAPMIPGIQ